MAETSFDQFVQIWFGTKPNLFSIDGGAKKSQSQHNAIIQGLEQRSTEVRELCEFNFIKNLFYGCLGERNKIFLVKVD